VGLWIGAVISNTSHSNNAGSTPQLNEHGSQVKDQGRRQCCHNKHKKISLSAYTWCIFTFLARLVTALWSPKRHVVIYTRL